MKISSWFLSKQAFEKCKAFDSNIKQLGPQRLKQRGKQASCSRYMFLIQLTNKKYFSKNFLHYLNIIIIFMYSPTNE